MKPSETIRARADHIFHGTSDSSYQGAFNAAILEHLDERASDPEAVFESWVAPFPRRLEKLVASWRETAQKCAGPQLESMAGEAIIQAKGAAIALCADELERALKEMLAPEALAADFHRTVSEDLAYAAKRASDAEVARKDPMARFIMRFLMDRNGGELREPIRAMGAENFNRAVLELCHILVHRGRPPNWVEETHVEPCPPEAFSPGDVVQLKSGGPLMTVSGSEDSPEGDVYCIWLDRDRQHEGFFDYRTLRRIESR